MSITPGHLEDFPLDGEVTATGEYNGYIWVTMKAPRYGVNGYVRIPDNKFSNHPWAKSAEIFEPYESDLRWSEVTYRSGNWFGFDTAHLFNYWPEEYIWSGGKSAWEIRNCFHDEYSIIMTPERVEHMTLEFAKQASEAYL